MPRTSLFSWRMPLTLRTALSQEAEREGLPLARLLEAIVSEWMGRHELGPEGERTEQERLHAAVLSTCGTLSLDPRLGENASKQVREAIEARRRRR